VRPDRDNIAAPDLPQKIAWIGEVPESMPALTAGGPALVHFFDFAQLNSVRTLPYLAEWERRYREAGLSVIGVQAPRFPFGTNPELVAAGLRRLGVSFPVAIDAGRELWHAYGCTGWPSLFLWATGGALAWVHFGEGEYLGTELAIQEELREMDALRDLPDAMEALRPSDSASARVMPPSEEIFPSESWEQPWVAGEDGEELVVPYEAGGAHATLEGEGTMALEVDGEETRTVRVSGPGLYALVEHPHHESHTIALRPSPGLRIWSISFAAGVP
jgi:Thioredoxin like C-terminal domain